jgi:hypothetical protein
VASRRRLRRNQCSGKIRYQTEEAGQAAVRSIIRAGKVMGHKGFLKPYLCKWCHGWHVGHT